MLVKPTFSMICLWEIMENIGKTNNFHRLPLVFMLLRDKSRPRYRGGGVPYIYIYIYICIYIHSNIDIFFITIHL